MFKNAENVLYLLPIELISEVNNYLKYKESSDKNQAEFEAKNSKELKRCKSSERIRNKERLAKEKHIRDTEYLQKTARDNYNSKLEHMKKVEEEQRAIEKKKVEKLSQYNKKLEEILNRERLKKEDGCKKSLITNMKWHQELTNYYLEKSLKERQIGRAHV